MLSMLFSISFRDLVSVTVFIWCRRWDPCRMLWTDCKDLFLMTQESGGVFWIVLLWSTSFVQRKLGGLKSSLLTKTWAPISTRYLEFHSSEDEAARCYNKTLTSSLVAFTLSWIDPSLADLRPNPGLPGQLSDSLDSCSSFVCRSFFQIFGFLGFVVWKRGDVVCAGSNLKNKLEFVHPCTERNITTR